MWRTALAVLVGYFVIAAVVMATFTAAYAALGTEGSFRAGTFEPSPAWIAVSFALGLVAAVAGGLVSARMDPVRRAPVLLMGLVLVVGLAFAAVHTVNPPPPAPARTGDLPVFEAARQAQQPRWVEWVNPLVGAVGIWLGSGALTRSRDAEST